MHPSELPREPNGNADAAGWLRKILKCVRERTFIAGKGIKLEHKTNGTVIHATAQPGSGGGAAGFRWRGEYSSANPPADGLGPYIANDLVIRGSNNPSSTAWNTADAILQDGTKAGLYIALTTVPNGTAPTEPPDGVYWETVSRGAWHKLKVTLSGGQSSLFFESLPLDAKAIIGGGTTGSVQRLVTIDTAAARALGLDGDKGRPLSIVAIRDCEPSDGTAIYNRLILASARYRVS